MRQILSRANGSSISCFGPKSKSCFGVIWEIPTLGAIKPFWALLGRAAILANSLAGHCQLANLSEAWGG
jgi:hypothetical protein